MNTHQRIKLPVSPDYDEDGYGWAMAQAQLLRERRFADVDWDNVIDEVECVGKSEQRSATSALRVVLLHLLKWDYQPAFRSKSWARSIALQLENFDGEMSKNPSLKSRLDEIRADAFRGALLDAVKETGLDDSAFPIEAYDWDRIRTPVVFDPDA